MDCFQFFINILHLDIFFNIYIIIFIIIIFNKIMHLI